jgi:flavin-binding protein dodecin
MPSSKGSPERRRRRNVRSAWIKEQHVRCDNGRIAEYQVNMMVTFVLDD